MSVKVLYLNAGERVLGDMSEERNDVYVFKNAFILKEILTEQGLSFIPAPLMLTTDREIFINKKSVCVHPCNPDAQLSNLHQQITSNLLVPKSNLVI